MLELVAEKPDWVSALGVALIRPPGVPERRAGDDPWESEPSGRPRRATDDLAWLRQAVDEPQLYGLRPLPPSAAVAAWEAETDAVERVERLRARGVLHAAGFLLHDGTLDD